MAAPLQYSADGPPRLAGEDQIAETRAVAGWVLDQILVMLHPVMPFITEELWSKMGARDHDLIVAKWPEPAAGIDAEAAEEVEWLIALVSQVRAARNELGIPPGTRLTAFVRDPSQQTINRINAGYSAIQRQARLDVDTHQPIPIVENAIQLVIDEATFVLPLEGVIDLDAERTRLTKSIDSAAKERDALAARLANPAFVERAKPEAVEKARADHAEKAAEAERLQAALDRLG